MCTFPILNICILSADELLSSSQQSARRDKTEGLQIDNWIEWQRHLQGINDAPHSHDTHCLTALLQLADRLTLNNATLLTQTTGNHY